MFVYSKIVRNLEKYLLIQKKNHDFEKCLANHKLIMDSKKVCILNKVVISENVRKIINSLRIKKSSRFSKNVRVFKNFRKFIKYLISSQAKQTNRLPSKPNSLISVSSSQDFGYPKNAERFHAQITDSSLKYSK